MAFLPAVASLILVVATVHLALGWLMANGLRNGALLVREPAPAEALAVRTVSEESISLEAAGPRQDIGHPGVIGLRWKSGYGQLGRLIDVEHYRVTRLFELLEGTPPSVCPDLPVRDCPPVFTDGYAFPNGPGDRDLVYEDVTYRSPLGPMSAWIVPSTGTVWAIHVHGWTADRREAVRLLPALNRLGVTSMVIEYRNDPGAPRDPSGHHRFGLSEWIDVEAAVSHAIAEGAESIVFIGYSTGAAHVLSFLENSEHANRVIALVLDSPNVILSETVRHGSRGTKIPGLGIEAGNLLIELGMWIADLRWGVDWDRTDYVQRAETIIRVPTLVFHGTSDQRVPISVSRKLEARVPLLVQLEETPAAGHVMSWNADPARYEELLETFLENLQN